MTSTSSFTMFPYKSSRVLKYRIRPYTGQMTENAARTWCFLILMVMIRDDSFCIYHPTICEGYRPVLGQKILDKTYNQENRQNIHEKDMEGNCSACSRSCSDSSSFPMIQVSHYVVKLIVGDGWRRGGTKRKWIRLVLLESVQKINRFDKCGEDQSFFSFRFDQNLYYFCGLNDMNSNFMAPFQWKWTKHQNGQYDFLQMSGVLFLEIITNDGLFVGKSQQQKTCNELKWK